MEKRTIEWLEQADYDLDTADYMLKGGRMIYTVFMCHLAVEKALKGVYFEKRKEIPPKSHNLVFLLDRLEQKPPDHLVRFMVKLSEAAVTTRYPENLAAMQQSFSEAVVQDILGKAREVINWTKTQL